LSTITALFIATIESWVSFADTAFTVVVNFEPSEVTTDVLTIGAAFWKPVTCFGSASTVYLEPLPSGGSVEKTSAARMLPLSSAAYAEIPASGTNCTWVSHTASGSRRGTSCASCHSGNAPNLKLPTFFRSPNRLQPVLLRGRVRDCDRIRVRERRRPQDGQPVCGFQLLGQQIGRLCRLRDDAL